MNKKQNPLYHLTANYRCQAILGCDVKDLNKKDRAILAKKWDRYSKANTVVRNFLVSIVRRKKK